MHEASKHHDVIALDRASLAITDGAAVDRAMGDLRAQITALKTGERRFTELLARYGR